MAYRVLGSWGGPCARACRELLLGKERAHDVRGRDDRDGDRERRQAVRLGGRRRRGRIGLCHNGGPALRRTVGVELLRQLHGVIDSLQVVADLVHALGARRRRELCGLRGRTGASGAGALSLRYESFLAKLFARRGGVWRARADGKQILKKTRVVDK